MEKLRNTTGFTADEKIMKKFVPLAGYLNVDEIDDIETAWKKIVGTVGQNNLALDTILSRARAGKIEGDELVVYVKYDFHRQQLMNEKNRSKFEEIISSIVGRAMKVRCEVSNDKSIELKNDTITETLVREDDLLSQAEAIFVS